MSLTERATELATEQAVERERLKAIDDSVEIACFESHLSRVAEELKIERLDTRNTGRFFRYALVKPDGGTYDHTVMIHIPADRESCEFVYVGRLAAQQASDMLRRLAAA